MSIALAPVLTSPQAICRDGVYYLADPAPYEWKERRYLELRTHEGRIYPDEIVRGLPSIAPDHPLAGEWAARAASLARLERYLANRSPHLVLDLGCGNGWLANRLASAPSAEVYGMDLNQVELAQAARVFAPNPRLTFLYGDVFTAPLPSSTFDLILLASAIQYFPDLPALLRRLLLLLAPGGEIHIVDSPVYAAEEIPAAKERTRAYYSGRGFPEMTAEYHHHRLDGLQPFHATTLSSPRSWRNRLLRRSRPGVSPFPWIRVMAHPSDEHPV